MTDANEKVNVNNKDMTPISSHMGNKLVSKERPSTATSSNGPGDKENNDEKVTILDFLKSPLLLFTDYKQYFEFQLKFGASNLRRVIYVIIFVFMMLIPFYYAVTQRIPPESELLKSTGTILFQGSSISNIRTGLKTEDKEIIFSCQGAYLYGGGRSCYVKRDIMDRIQGRQGKVLWYKQPVYPFIAQNHLVELWDGDEVIITRDSSQARIDRTKKRAIWGLPILLIFFVAADWFFIKMYQIRKRRK